ncbi:MAG: sucrose phosphorylase [Bacteroidota bacterium]
MKNQVQLTTYVDRLTGAGLKELFELLNGPMQGMFGGVHMLPFFYPIDGADAGFDPIDHTQVDERLGTWEEVAQLAQTHDVMADIIVNHMSAQSPQFQDVLARGEQSPYAPLFLTMDSVFPAGATEKDFLTIYRPRPGLPYSVISLADSEKRLFWTTFTSNQIDIDVQHPQGEAYLDSILARFHQAGVTIIRLDAAGYAIKKAGTSCFMIPETYEFIADFTAKAQALGMKVLVEIHSYFREQIEIAKRVDYVYDFALPPLVLHALFTQTAQYLKKWFAISPPNAITVLDTHDGIGIIDIGPSGERPGLVPDADIDLIVETIHERSQGQSRKATGAAASNLDLYQVNCTYYDALGRDDHQYLLARMIQFFAPGVPQVYYTGALAEPNDMALLEATNVGRDINRHHFAFGEAAAALKRPVVKQLANLMRFRNQHPAFNGEFIIADAPSHQLQVRWQKGLAFADLVIDFQRLSFVLSFSQEGKTQRIENDWTEIGKRFLASPQR